MNACIVICTLLAALAVAGVDSAEDVRWAHGFVVRLVAVLGLGAWGAALVVLMRCPPVP